MSKFEPLNLRTGLRFHRFNVSCTTPKSHILFRSTVSAGKITSAQFSRCSAQILYLSGVFTLFRDHPLNHPLTYKNQGLAMHYSNANALAANANANTKHLLNWTMQILMHNIYKRCYCIRVSYKRFLYDLYSFSKLMH